MFLTTPSNRHPIKSALAGHGCDVWTQISLTMNFPWYCLTSSYVHGMDAGLEQTRLLSDPVQVGELLGAVQDDIQVDQLLLVSPPRLNGTRNWQMEPLSEVWRGRPSENGFFIYVYVLNDGRRYISSPDSLDERTLQDLKQIIHFCPRDGIDLGGVNRPTRDGYLDRAPESCSAGA